MNRASRFIFLSLVNLCLSNCRHNQHVTGGPCGYNITNYPAIILEIYQLDSVKSEMILVANMNGYLDTLYYSQAARQYISNTEIMSSKLKQGDTLTYQHKQMISGSCNPDIFILTKDRFKK